MRGGSCGGRRGLPRPPCATLGLAIAANVVVFGVLNALVLRPVQGNDSGRLFNVVQGPYGNENQSYPDYVDYRRYNTAFSNMAAYRIEPVGLVTSGRALTCWDRRGFGQLFRHSGCDAGAWPILSRHG